LEQLEIEHSYFIFERNLSKDIDELFGPLLNEEIQEIKKDLFEDSKTVEILDEKTFKTLYFEEYVSAFTMYWYDFIETLSIRLQFQYEIFCSENDGVMFLDNDNEDHQEELDFLSNENNLDSNIQNIIFYGLCDIYRDTDDEHNILYVSISLDADPSIVSYFIHQLTLYCLDVFELKIVEPHYIDQNDDYHESEDAIEVFGIENFLTQD
jgi:hypothetical protein